jgi:hypothetical protein
VLASVDHPTLLKFVGAVDSPPYAIVTEWMPGGTLYHDLHKTRRLNPTQLTIAAVDIARGIEYLHARSIVHRDLKTLNVLLTDDGFARICDFGFSRHVRTSDAKMTGNVGTPHWMAPEVLAGSGVYDEKVDVYAFAIVLWELLVKKLPYTGMESTEIVAQVAMNDIRPPIPPTCPAPLRALIEICWLRDPTARPSFRQILEQMLSAGVVYPGGNAAVVRDYIVAHLGPAQPSPAVASLADIAQRLSEAELPSDEVDRCWDALGRIGRDPDPALFLRCLCHFVGTQRSGDAMPLLLREPPGALPRPLAVALAALLPTGRDGLSLDIVVLACRNGAAAEAALHSMHPNHIKLALEVVARAGTGADNRQFVVQRCLHSIMGNDPMLVVAAIRCIVAIGEARALPLERIRVCLESRNTTVKLAAWVALAEMAAGGIELPRDVVDACIERAAGSRLAVNAVVAACGVPEAARYVVGRLAAGWTPGGEVALRILLKASRHRGLAHEIRMAAAAIGDADQAVADGIAVLLAAM